MSDENEEFIDCDSCTGVGEILPNLACPACGGKGYFTQSELDAGL